MTATSDELRARISEYLGFDNLPPMPKSPLKDTDYNSFTYSDALYTELYKFFKILRVNGDIKVELQHFQLQALARYLDPGHSVFKRQINADDTGLGKSFLALACATGRFMPRIDEPLTSPEDIHNWTSVRLYKERMLKLYKKLCKPSDDAHLRDHEDLSAEPDYYDLLLQKLARETTFVTCHTNELDNNWNDQINQFYGDRRAYVFIMREPFANRRHYGHHLLEFYKESLGHWLSTNNIYKNSQLPPQFFVVMGLDRAKVHCFYKNGDEKAKWVYDKTSVKEEVFDELLEAHEASQFKWPYDEQVKNFKAFFPPHSIFGYQWFFKVFDEAHSYFNATSKPTLKSVFAHMFARAGFATVDDDTEDRKHLVPRSTGVYDDPDAAARIKARIRPLRVLALTGTPIVHSAKDVKNLLILIRVHPHLDWHAAGLKILKELGKISSEISNKALFHSNLDAVRSYAEANFSKKRKHDDTVDHAVSSSEEETLIECEADNKNLVSDTLKALRSFMMPYMISRKKFDPVLKLGLPPINERQFNASPCMTDVLAAMYNGIVIGSQLATQSILKQNKIEENPQTQSSVLCTIETLRIFFSDPHSALAKLHYFSSVRVGSCSQKDLLYMLYFFLLATKEARNKPSASSSDSDSSDSEPEFKKPRLSSSNRKSSKNKLSDFYPDLVQSKLMQDFAAPQLDLCNHCFIGLSAYCCKSCGKHVCLHCITRATEAKSVPNGLCPECCFKKNSADDYNKLIDAVIQANKSMISAIPSLNQDMFASKDQIKELVKSIRAVHLHADDSSKTKKPLTPAKCLKQIKSVMPDDDDHQAWINRAIQSPKIYTFINALELKDTNGLQAINKTKFAFNSKHLNVINILKMYLELRPFYMPDGSPVQFVCIDGQRKNSKNAPSRFDLFKAFKDDDSVRICLLTDCANTGFGAANSATVIMIDHYKWSHAFEIQLINRFHRLGQVLSLNVCHLFVPDSFDQALYSLAERKQLTTNLVSTPNMLNDKKLNTPESIAKHAGSAYVNAKSGLREKAQLILDLGFLGLSNYKSYDSSDLHTL